MASFVLSESSVTIDELKSQFLQRQSSGAYPMQQSKYNTSIEVCQPCRFIIVNYLVERILSKSDSFIETIDNIFDMQIDLSMFKVLTANSVNTSFERTYEHHILRVVVSVNDETKGILVELYVAPIHSDESSFDKEFESFMIETKVCYAIHDAVLKYGNDCEHEPEPYQVSPEDIYCTSLNSYYYDKQQVDDIIYISMCNLYEKVIPQVNMTEKLFDQMTEAGIQPPEAHMPYHTPISDQSYVYTSEYKYNKFEVMIMEQNPERFGRRMYVRFTIVPKYMPSTDSDIECRKIEDLVLDNIYNTVQSLFEYIEDEDWVRANEKDEHSYQGNMH